MQFPPRYLLWVSALAAACSGSVSGPGSGNGGQDDGEGGEGGGSLPPEVAEACSDQPNVGPSKWRRLSTTQYKNAVTDLLGVAPDTKGFLFDSTTGPFATNTTLNPQDVDIAQYASAAEALAAKATADVNKLIDCDPRTQTEDACANRFIDNFATRAFRRPIESTEQSRLRELYKLGKAQSFTDGIRLVLQAILQSPSFLYLVERGQADGKGIVPLTDHEVAARLSFTLTATLPDSQLLAAAKDKKLSTAQGIRAEAMRLMNSPRFNEASITFATELLGLPSLTRGGFVTKSGGDAAMFDDSMRQAMLDEPRKFVDYVMNKGSGTVEELLSAPYVFPTGPLTKIYGPSLSPDGDGRAVISDGSRMGLLSLAGVQASHPHVPTIYGAVVRGNLVRRELLCMTIPPPNVAVKFEAPPNASQMSPQQLLRAHQDNDTCRPCHELMDPIGFGLERYDGVGRLKEKNGDGSQVDSSGEILGLENEYKFSDTQELLQTLATMPEVRRCMATQLVRFSLAREPDDADACAARKLQSVLADGKGNLRDAILTLVTSDAFRYRKGE